MIPNDALEHDYDGYDDKPQEECGVFGLYAPMEDVAKLAYFGLFALQHRGQESAGIVAFEDGRVHSHKDMGLVSQVFSEEILADLNGTHAIGHNRYSTTGSSHIRNAQPAIVDTRRGKFALAHNGNLVNTRDLRNHLDDLGCNFDTTSDSEAIAIAIGVEVDRGLEWIEALQAALNHCKGAFSLTIGTTEAVYGIRDPNGVRPLVIGQLDRGGYVFASESCGLDIIGAKYLREVQPGEIVRADAEGLHSTIWKTAQPKLCVFEMIYFARPDSGSDLESLYSYRIRIGQLLAQEAPADVDLIVGIPDSGIPAAIGFARESGIPYAEGLIKNRYVGRTFIQPTQSMRETGIRMKLNPLKDVLNGKRVLLVDDSIVRGTTSRKIVKAVRSAGATEVHMRISSPPVTHPCFYGIDTDAQDQLVAASKSVEEIGQQIGADSLAYLSWEGMLQATNRNPEHFCSACFTGNYPIEVPEMLKRSKLMLERVSPS